MSNLVLCCIVTAFAVALDIPIATGGEAEWYLAIAFGISLLVDGWDFYTDRVWLRSLDERD